MVYIAIHILNPHVQRVWKMCGKGGIESLRPSYGRPKLTLISREKIDPRRCYEKPLSHNFRDEASKFNEQTFDIYKKSVIQFGDLILTIVSHFLSKRPLIPILSPFMPHHNIPLPFRVAARTENNFNFLSTCCGLNFVIILLTNCKLHMDLLNI